MNNRIMKNDGGLERGVIQELEFNVTYGNWGSIGNEGYLVFNVDL